MIRSIFAVSVIALVTLGWAVAAAGGDTPKTGFVNKVYQESSGYKSKYVVFIPRGYDGKKPYPAILFLHGLGQSGDDGLAQAGRGLGAAIRKRERTFPFVTIFPQSHKRSWKADSDDGKRALAILDKVQQDYKVDAKRIYVTGYSMGGEGTFSLAAAHRKRWAAIVPICGSADVSLAASLKDIPCWCFVGDADAPSTVYGVRSMMRAIKKAGGRPIYHEYPGVGHNCWDLTYDNPDVYEWLLLQKRP